MIEKLIEKFIVCLLMLTPLLLLLIFLVLSRIYIREVFHRHREHRDRDKELFKGNKVLPLEVTNIYVSIVERRYSSIQNYFIYQVVNKVSGFIGVLYSFLGFGLSFIETTESSGVSMKFICAEISLISIVSVIIALYLSPAKRIVEYINAWRIYDKKVNEMSGKLASFINKVENDKDPTKIHEILFREDLNEFSLNVINETAEFVYAVESSINSDEE